MEILLLEFEELFSKPTVLSLILQSKILWFYLTLSLNYKRLFDLLSQLHHSIEGIQWRSLVNNVILSTKISEPFIIDSYAIITEPFIIELFLIVSDNSI